VNKLVDNSLFLAARYLITLLLLKLIKRKTVLHVFFYNIEGSADANKIVNLLQKNPKKLTALFQFLKVFRVIITNT
jgi:hypothetical protein